jgi:hypothetical protein
MPDMPYLPAGTDTVFAGRTSAEDDASISWSREPDEPDQSADPAQPDQVAAESTVTLWSDVGAQAFRDRWRQVQLRFVDDPPAVVRDAEALVTEATDELAAVIAAQRDDLAGWRSGEGDDTEDLRVAIRRYREFLDRVLDL